jgi:phage terminase large subunit GpA-like protein
LLVAGIDTQSGSKDTEGRLEVEVVAFGLGEESWSIDYQIFSGDPAKPEVWQKLDTYLKKPWRHESGLDLAVMGNRTGVRRYDT